ncbi:LOW QUALITY PROTEIN: L-threonine 3-dehydrogenase-like [Uloborus diversus]|uniref:LOW QUALITY PROTEIN: L-threonine 3-dehydrogenase-like n=1 Tax=Uloborus diversus TaxID=327109 RepID=UPI0024095505|nr:LOW QUALITY PROTEIN: L-threonine 3-dehydrogenase-like [Uloborus diversus]
MAAGATGVRVVFFGAHKHPSYVVETCSIPSKDELREGEILIKILYATICSIDIEDIDGKRDVKKPCVLGHEGIGEVVHSKRERDPFVPGDRVTFGMSRDCGECQMCRADMGECCSRSARCGSMGLKEGSGLSGCFATHMVLERGATVALVPTCVSNAVACPANCALSTIVHAVSYATSSTKLPQSVAIVQGANLMGLYACALLRESGFREVYCHDICRERLRLVPRFGGRPVLVESVLEEGCGVAEGVADVVMDVCGKWDVVSYALHSLRHRGMYLIVGSTHSTGATMDLRTVLRKCITIRGIQSYKAEHLQKAMDFLSATANKYPYESLISSPFPLQEFHSAVVTARTKRYCRTAIAPRLHSP